MNSLLALPVPILAHSTLPGAGDFINGILHPLFTPAHLLLLLALGLWLGQTRPLSLAKPAALFALAAALGLAATRWLPPLPEMQVFLAIAALVPALLVVFERRFTLLLGLPIVALAAASMALDSGPESTVRGAAAMLSGTWLALTLVFINVPFYLALLPDKPAARIGLRVAASWISAIALMLLAFALRPATAGRAKSAHAGPPSLLQPGSPVVLNG